MRFATQFETPRGFLRLRQLQVPDFRFVRAPDEFVFIGKRADKLPENVLLASIKRYSSDKSDTAHGVRATKRTWLEESHDFGEELLEVSMQHVVGTLTQRAYNRSDWLEKRRPVMEAISDWLLG